MGKPHGGARREPGATVLSSDRPDRRRIAAANDRAAAYLRGERENR